MRIYRYILALIVALPINTIACAESGDQADPEVTVWSQAFAAWVDVSHNITCPELKPRIDALTTRLGSVQDAFMSKHPNYVFPPSISARSPFVDCANGTRLIVRAEALAGEAERIVGRER
ncbi:exported hypothetical protein [Novosphingobium sp. 9U]|nr:exported hypothetical protein [Novosphingobium sp. 9U]